MESKLQASANGACHFTEAGLASPSRISEAQSHQTCVAVSIQQYHDVVGRAELRKVLMLSLAALVSVRSLGCAGANTNSKVRGAYCTLPSSFTHSTVQAL